MKFMRESRPSGDYFWSCESFNSDFSTPSVATPAFSGLRLGVGLPFKKHLFEGVFPGPYVPSLTMAFVSHGACWNGTLSGVTPPTFEHVGMCSASVRLQRGCGIDMSNISKSPMYEDVPQSEHVMTI